MPNLQEIEAAGQREGWRLVTTIDNGTTHPYYDIAGTQFSDAAARQLVAAKAKRNSAVHQEAMRLVMHSRVKSGPKPKSRK